MSGVVSLIAVFCLIATGFLFGWSVSAWTGKDVWSALGAIGSWVSGLGAFAAAFAAWQISEKQIKLDTEFLEIKFSFVLLGVDLKKHLMVSALSKGRRPSEVCSVSIFSEDAEVSMLITKFAQGSNQLPVNVGYGRQVNFILESGFERHIAKYVNTHCNGSAQHLKVCVNTTTMKCVHKFDGPMVVFMENEAKKIAEEDKAT